MSEFRDFAMLSVGRSASDTEVLARAVRKHKAGDLMAQAALTIALMLAICAVTFALSVDRASAMSLASSALDAGTAGSGAYTSTIVLLVALAAVAGGALMASRRIAAQRDEERRLVRVPVRRRM